MPAAPSAPLALVPREPPLEPRGVAARGAAATALARRLLRLDPAHLSRLVGVAGAGLLVVIGEATDLPWTDGVTYLGFDDGLWMPCWLQPSVHPQLAARALARGGKGPHALLPASDLGGSTVVPLGDVHGLDAARLAEWLSTREPDSATA